MNTAEITVLEEVELNNPVFIEALPGLGHVGKLAADHMIDELGATKFAEIYSPTFPPQVLVKEEGIIENMFNELYYLKDVGEENLDLIILVGNTQALSPEGQYLVCKEILDFVCQFDIDRIFTLGGMVTSPQPVENPNVFGAATCEANVELLKEAEVEIRSNDEALLLKLSHLLNFEINTEKLDERAEETRQMIAKAQQMEQDLINKANAGNADDLRYIG